MRRFKAGDEHLRVEPAFYFGRVGAFQKEFDGFFHIGGGGFNRIPLAGHVEFRHVSDVGEDHNSSGGIRHGRSDSTVIVSSQITTVTVATQPAVP